MGSQSVNYTFAGEPGVGCLKDHLFSGAGSTVSSTSELSGTSDTLEKTALWDICFNLITYCKGMLDSKFFIIFSIM